MSTLFPLAGRASDGSDGAQVWNELKVTAPVTNNIDFAGSTQIVRGE
jgi:hypothetical protein